MNYKNVKSLHLEYTCVNISNDLWEHLMKDAKVANKREINILVKRFLPELYEELGLDFYNPYQYYRTDTHLVLVHSMIEYFLKYFY